MPPSVKTADQIEVVSVIGAGTMGRQIALQCALYGLTVLLYDVDLKVLGGARKQIENYLEQFNHLEQFAKADPSATLERIQLTIDPKEAAQCDLISESVPEDPVLKRNVFKQFGRLCPQHTVFTTNSSSLVPSMFADSSGRADRLAALHFHQPIWISNVVDVMPHAGTSPQVLDAVEGFARRIGQIPIRLQKESYGYVFNAMLNALNREAITLVANGITSVENVDRAWMGIMKMPIGPFGILDGVGLETVWHITSYWAGQLGDVQLEKNAQFLKTYLDAGKLGLKSGEGFYRYPDPAYQQPNFLTQPEDD
ncbi:MAG: 3-hydroxyacyl-CoA dehydrogenase [Chloroflexi bacterium]|nr:3-hydroxyacyl-CoA dehydrogenase [Chloroflexota bacterium]